MADVTLTIDADTARYIANIAKAAEATKGLGKPVKEVNELWEAGVEVLGSKLMKLSLVGAAVEVVKTGVEAVTEQYDHWIERLKEAEKTLQSIATSGKGATGGTLSGPGAARGALMGLDNQLSNDQRFSAYAAYRAANPGGTIAQGTQAVSDAAKAEAAGLNANEFAGAAGKLRGLGAGTNDIVAQLMSNGGAQGGQAVDVLSDALTKLGPDQAKAMMPALLSSFQSPGGTGLVGSALNTFTSQGRQGSFADTFQNQGISLVPGLDTRAQLGQIQQGAGKFRGGGLGYFEALSGAAEGDAVNSYDASQRRYKQRKENREYVENAPSALRRSSQEEFQDTYNKNAWMNPFFSKNANEAARKSHYYDSYGNENIRNAANHANDMDRTADLLEQQLEIMRENSNRPANGTQGEKAAQ